MDLEFCESFATGKGNELPVPLSRPCVQSGDEPAGASISPQPPDHPRREAASFNKSLKPTLTAVMTRADARIMPAASVAHL